jgi:archaellum component FlaF (FlaF/FlaG flagellin family)
MLSRKLVTKLTKVFYAFGIVFLLTGLLLSAVNIPVLAQEEPPAPQEEQPTPQEEQPTPEPQQLTPPTVDQLPEAADAYCCDPDPVYPVVTIESAGCEQIVFKISGTKNPSQGFTMYVGITPESQPYVASVDPARIEVDYFTPDRGDGKGEWTEYVTVTLTGGWQTALAGSASVTLQATAYGFDDSIGEWVVIGEAQTTAYNDQCGASPDLSLTASCPDYGMELNVWTLTNNGNQDTDYTCTGCSDAGPGTVPLGGFVTLYGPRIDGTETITVNYSNGLTAGGDNTGMTDAEALANQCYVPAPQLDVVVTLGNVDCTYAYFDVTVTNNGDAAAEDVSLAYQASGAAAGTVNPASTTVGSLGVGETTGPYQVVVPVSWLTEDTGEFITLTAQSFIGQTQAGSNSADAYNPGTCQDSSLSVNVVTVTQGCDSATFEVTLTNNGDGTANNVTLDYAAAGDNVNGDPTPLSTTVGSLAPGASVGPFTVTVPIDWGNSDDFNLNVSLTASAKVDGTTVDEAYDLAYNQEQCYTPEPVVTLDASDVEQCGIYPSEVCVDFTLSISNLPEGSVVTVAGQEFDQNGTFPVQICGDWPGVGLGNDPVQVELFAEAYLDGQFMDDAISLVSYTPGVTECQLPEGRLVIQDPFCYAVHPGYKAAWRVENTSGFPIDFTWQLNGGEMNVETAPANGVVWLGSFALDRRNTVTISWNGNVDELSGSISSNSCHGPTPPPPPEPPSSYNPPVPVTAVEQPAPVVEAGVLIPVTGVDLGTSLDVSFFKKLMIYLGMSFLGLAFIAHSLRSRFK